MVIVVIYSLTEKLRVGYKNVDFPAQFCLESISEKFNYVESEEVSFTENVYNFEYSQVFSG